MTERGSLSKAERRQSLDKEEREGCKIKIKKKVV